MALAQLDAPNVEIPLAASVECRCQHCNVSFIARKPKHGPKKSTCKQCRDEAQRKCKAENIERLRAYRRAWKAKNRDKIRAQIAAARRENPQRFKQYTDKWRDKNKERVKRVRIEYVNRERERLKVKQQQYRASNKSALSAKAADWQKKNAAYCAASRAARRAMQLMATPAWANHFFIEEAYRLARLRTDTLGYKWHVDHIVPLKSSLVCGLHVEHNLRVIPGALNVSKNNRHWPDMP